MSLRIGIAGIAGRMGRLLAEMIAGVLLGPSLLSSPWVIDLLGHAPMVPLLPGPPWLRRSPKAPARRKRPR